MRQTVRRRNNSWLLLLVLSAAVFLMAAAVLVSGYVVDAGEENEFEALVKRIQTASMHSTNEGKPDVSKVQASPEKPSLSDRSSGEDKILSGEKSEYVILEKYAGLHKENPDMGGWIRIDDTKVNYPVMFTPDEPEKYLHLSFEGKYSFRGVPFIGEDCKIAPRSQNIILYGHHMKNGSMFAAIVKYKDIDFWQKHKTIYFSTLYEEGEYEVFAAFETDVYAAKELRCYNFINARDEADFNKYISAIHKVACYDTGVDAAYGDELLTLSTCSYHTNDGRFVVLARKKH